MLSDHKCPNCKVTLGSLRALDDQGNSNVLHDGEHNDAHTLCIVCGAFLKILAYREGRAQARIMTAEEILAMPDAERIALQRLRRAVSDIPPEILKDSIERYQKNREIMARVEGELTKMLDAEIVKHFGNDVGCALILKDLKPLGFQGITSNMPNDVLAVVLNRAAATYNGELNGLVKKVLLGG